MQIFQSGHDLRNRILVAGCDPAISVLARHVQAAGIELVLAHRNSSQALALLQDGCVHIAGTHLRDSATGESNIAEVGRLFPKKSVAPGVRRAGLKKLSARLMSPPTTVVPSLASRATVLFSRLWPKRNARVENSVA